MAGAYQPALEGGEIYRPILGLEHEMIEEVQIRIENADLWAVLAQLTNKTLALGLIYQITRYQKFDWLMPTAQFLAELEDSEYRKRMSALLNEDVLESRFFFSGRSSSPRCRKTTKESQVEPTGARGLATKTRSLRGNNTWQY